MNLSEYCSYDGLGLAELVKKGEISAKELGELMLAAHNAVNPQINAVIEPYRETIAAMSPDDRPTGPFAGVPLLRKDLFLWEAGQKLENGSRLWADYVSDHDSWLTTRFKASGAFFAGRTNSPEFGLSGSTETVIHGNTGNPWNPTFMAGGSSGGSAAAVAAGIAPLGHASDGAGSIRIPASACGLVGLKPSRGRINPAPYPGQPFEFAVNFVVTRTVRDTAAMLDAVHGAEPGAYMTIAPPERPYLEEMRVPLKPLRIAFTSAQWGPMATESGPAALVKTIADHLADQGHQVTEASPSYDYEAYLKAMIVLWSFGVDLQNEADAKDFARPLDATTLEAVTLAQHHYAKTLTKVDYFAALEQIHLVNREAAAFFAHYDLLMTPTLSRPPQPLGYYSQNNPNLDFHQFFRHCDNSMAYMPLANFSGQPAISLPLGMSSTGLPMGVQFIAHPGDEATLIRLAAHFEEALPWREKKPPIWAGNTK